MFSYCEQLQRIDSMATNISAEECLSYWLDESSASGELHTPVSAPDYPTGVHGLPAGWVQIKDL